MWKVISLSVLLIVAQAADINDLYGNWIEAAFYPNTTYIPLCIRFTFTKGAEDVQCTYADGRNATTVQASMKAIITDELVGQHPIPIMVVDTPAEVMPALNMSVKCGDKDIASKSRAVARVVNQDYFVLYSYIPESKAHTRSETEPNSAMLFGRNVVSSEELSSVMMGIEDLKNRRGAQMCTTENYVGFHTSENKVGNH